MAAGCWRFITIAIHFFFIFLDYHESCSAFFVSSTEIKGPRNATSLSQSDNFGDYEVSLKYSTSSDTSEVYPSRDEFKELKQGYLAQKHALVTAKNLKLLMTGGKESKLAIHEPQSSPKMIVSLGGQDAVALFSFTTINGIVPGMIKSKDLYVAKTRKKMGLQSK